MREAEEADRSSSGNNDVRKKGKRKKRGRGRKSKIGTRIKKHKPTEKAEAGTSDASADSSMTDTDFDNSLEHTVCSEPLDTPHECYETDGFSDSTFASEYRGSSTFGETSTTETESGSISTTPVTKWKPKRKLSSLLAYKRKGSSRNPKQPDEAGCSNDNEEDNVNVDSDSDELDISGISSDDLLDLSGLSSDGALNLTAPAGGTSDSTIAVVSLGSAALVPDATPTEMSDSTPSNQSAQQHISVNNADVSSGNAATVLDSQQTAPNATLKEIPESTSSNQSTAEKTSLDESSKMLVQNLTLLLPDRWVVDAVNNKIIRIILLNEEKNAAVMTNIFWDFESWSVGIFVHNHPVPLENKIFKSVNPPEKDNIGSLSDFLRNLADKILGSKVCSGIIEHEAFWRCHKGFIDTSCSTTPCFRSPLCLLIIPEHKSICSNCQAALSKFQRDVKRREKGRDLYKIPDKYLTADELKSKKDFFKTGYQKEKRRADRLEKKVEQLQIKLDAALHDDLSSILRKNSHLMTPLQAIFWQSQMDALTAADKRGFRWHPCLIKLALHLHHLSATTKDFLGEHLLALPSNRILFDYSHFIEAKEGCQQEIIEDVVKKIKKCGSEDHYTHINLSFDEMHLRSGLVTNRSTGELIGFTNLSSVEEELKQLQEEIKNKTFKAKLAKKVLVYMVQGITSDFQDVIAVYSTDELSASQLHSRTWDVIYHLEDAGVKVLSLTCDGAAINRKFFKMHPSADPEVDFVYCTINLAAGDDRLLYFIIDPPHLLKTVRNCLANSFRHRKTRKLWKNGEYLTWEVFEVLYELTKAQKFRSHRLSKAHIKLTSFSCMNVSYATQILSSSVVKSIKKLLDNDKMKVFQTSELIKLITHMNRFFDCVNGKERDGEVPKKEDHKAYRESGDERLKFLEGEFLKFFSDWKEEILNRPGIFSDTDRSRMIISHQSLEALQITVKGFVGSIKYMLDTAKAPAVNGRTFNQDGLEQYFSMVRQKQGDNNNPLLKTVLDTRLSHHAAGQLSVPSKRGNTEVEKRIIDVDATPLRKRQKKEKMADN